MTSTQQSSSGDSSSTATLLQQQMSAAANAYTCKPIGSEREKPKNQITVQSLQQSQPVQLSQHVHSSNSSSNQTINGNDRVQVFFEASGKLNVFSIKQNLIQPQL